MKRGLGLDEYLGMMERGEDPHARLREVAKDEERPWATVGCCKACWYATEEKCVCRCLGANHGRGLEKDATGRGNNDL